MVAMSDPNQIIQKSLGGPNTANNYVASALGPSYFTQAANAPEPVPEIPQPNINWDALSKITHPEIQKMTLQWLMNMTLQREKSRMQGGGLRIGSAPWWLANATPEQIQQYINEKTSGRRQATPSELTQMLKMDDEGSMTLTSEQRDSITQRLYEYVETETGEAVPAGKATMRAITTPPKASNANSATGIPAPKTQAEYDAIPKGSKYKHPDGRIRTKQ